MRLDDEIIRRELLLVRETIRFVFKWFGWRKWLRVSGVIDSAWNDGDTESPELVRRMELNWLLANSRRLWSLKNVTLSRCRWTVFDRDRDTKIVTLSETLFGLPPATSCSLPLLIRSIMTRLLDLFPVSSDGRTPLTSEQIENIRVEFDRSYCVVPVVVVGNEKNFKFDRLLRSFDDATIVCMIQVLGSCLVPAATSSSVVYDESSSSIGSHFRVVLPLIAIEPTNGIATTKDIDRPYSPVNLLIHAASDVSVDGVVVPGHPCVLDEIRLVERTEGLRWWTISRNDVFSLLGMSPSSANGLADISDITVDKHAIMVANFLSSARNVDTFTDYEIGRTLVRAMLVKAVAVYGLTYQCNDKKSVPTANSHTQRAVLRTLDAMGLTDDTYFVDNCYERATALSRAIVDLSSDVPRNVNRVRLSRAIVCSSITDAVVSSFTVPLASDKCSGDRVRSVSMVMVATDVLLDARVVRAYREVSESADCGSIDTADCYQDGIYLRHKGYRDLGILLLPAHSSPVFDRVIDASMVDLERVIESANTSLLDAWPGLACNRRRNEDDDGTVGCTRHFLRMCLLFPSLPENSIAYERFLDPAVIAVLAHDTIAYFFPREVENVVSGSRFRADSSIDEPLVTSRASSLLGSLLQIDPYTSHVIRSESTRRPVEYASLPAELSMRIFLCYDAKLWMIMRSFGIKHALVRSSPTYYCPYAIDRGFGARYRGVPPLQNSTAYDQWKLYVYGFSESVNNADSSIIPVKSVHVSGPKSRVRRSDDLFPPTVCTKDNRGRNWLLHELDDKVQFRTLLQHLKLTEDSLQRMTVIRLVAWYVDHYDPNNNNAPTVSKIVSKRVYVVNGLLCLCEQMTKFVGVPGSVLTAIPKFASDWRDSLSPANFANYYVTPGKLRTTSDSVSSSPVTEVDDRRISLSNHHFYNQVFRPLYAENKRPGRVSYIEKGDFYVLSFDGASRLWFPMSRLLLKARKNPQLCYAGVPRHLVPLIDYLVRHVIKY